MKKTMERKGEIAMIFCDLNDAEIEQIVGGAIGLQQFAGSGTGISASSHIEVIGGSFALATTSAQTQVITLPDGHTLAFGDTSGYGIAYS